MISKADVLSLEERSINAWPALTSEAMQGWTFRFSGGFTKRANSANAVAPEGAFASVQSAAESAYAKQALPAIFRLTPLAPPEADALLSSSGYTVFDPSLVMTAHIEPYNINTRIKIESAPSEDWLAGFATANHVDPALRPTHDAIVRAIQQPTAFVTAYDGALPVGFGLGVTERGMVGLFDIVVSPAARGAGFGRGITLAILEWGRSQGADKAYLNVRAANTVALKLYSSLGFTKAYAYHYRIPPTE